MYTLLDEGRKHLKMNKFAKAADCFKQFLKLQGYEDNETVYLLGICYFHMANYQ
jgi:TolA-binding protein